MKKRILQLLLFTILSLSIHAQEYIKSVQHYNLEKGLETRSILSAFKDSDGFMWFGSDIGAYRFDGVEFKSYQRKRANNTSLFTSIITEDDQKNKWLFHPNHKGEVGGDISILPKDVDTLIAFNDFFKNTLPFPTEEMILPYPNTSKAILIISKKSGEVYEYTNGKFQKIFNVSTKPIDIVHAYNLLVDKDEKGNTWLVYDQQLYKILPDGTNLKKEDLPEKSLRLQIDQGRFWLIRDSMLYVKENEDSPLKKAAFELENTKDNLKQYRQQVRYGNIIVGKGKKSTRFSLMDYDNNITIDFDNLIEKLDFDFEYPNYHYFENKNTLWICTYDGVLRIEFKKELFRKVFQETSTRNIIRGENDKIWIASDRGFFEVDSLGKSPFKLIDEKMNTIQGGIKDTEGNYWFGSRGRGVYKLEKNDLWNFKKYSLNQKRRGVAILTIFQNKKDKRIWAAGLGGIYTYDVALDSFVIYDKIKDVEELEESTIRDIKSIEEGRTLLFASSIGIFQIDTQTGESKHYCSKNNSFPYDNIIYIHKDKKDGTLWIGTNQGGLIHWNFETGKIERFTKKEGLSDNKIYAVYEDELGYLWLPSNNGLMRFDKKTKEVTTFKKEDGLVHDEFNFFSHFQDEDGTLYFGGIRGVTSFHPKDIRVTGERPNLKLMNLEVLDEKGENLISGLEEYNAAKQIELSPSKATFKLTASLLDYKNPSANQYFYKIEGLENQWNLMEGNSIRMNGLPSGNYKISVKAKNSEGLWSANQLEIPIRMLKPFFLRWWFLALMALLLYGLVRLTIESRTYLLEKDKQKLAEEVAKRTEQIEEDKAVIEKQAEDLKKLDELKSRFFSNVTHELRTPLTLIIGPLKQLLKSESLDTPKARKVLKAIAQNGDQLKDLVEEILDLSRLDARKLMLNKEPVRLRNVIERWITNFEPEAENRKIKFKLEYGAATNLYLDLDTQKLERIVVNLLANAFKFTREGDAITLSVSEEDHQIKIEVKDTGLGIHKDDLPNIFQRFYQSNQIHRNLQGGLGIGLSLCDELAKLMNGKISATSKLGYGSTFTLVFPKEKVEGVMSPRDEEAYRRPLKIEKRKDIIDSGERKNILIVEDNVQMQNFVQEVLEPFANIQIANNGKEALKILHYQSSDIDLIVSDVMMPEMDGFTLLEILKMEKRWQMTPVVMLTARADIQDKISALTIGVDDYIVKPFEPDELVARVQNLLIKLDLRNEPIEPRQTDESQKETKEGYEMENVFEEVESADAKWLKEVEQIAVENITTPNFNVTQFAFEVHLGERQLSRKLKKMTGMSPGSYLKEVRLQKARHLLENRAFFTVAEVANHVGFNTTEYFSKIFKERFGKLPKEYFRTVGNG